MILICQTNSFAIDWIGIFISTFLSAIIGYFISIWAANNYEKSKHKRLIYDLNIKYSGHAGVFANYSIDEAFKQHKISEAKIEYFPTTGTNFKITVTTFLDNSYNPLQDIQIWEGEMKMESKKFGEISFNGVSPDNLKKLVGFKRIIYSSDLKVITVIGERLSGYFDEQFVREV